MTQGENTRVVTFNVEVILVAFTLFGPDGREVIMI